MILKIKYKDHWWIYGEIKKLRYTPQTIHIPEDKEFDTKSWKEKYDIVLLKNVCSCGPNDGCSDCPKPGTKIKYTEICFRDKNNDEYVLAFDTIAYLCNDEGKTIEKIVGRD